jgi:hypothetical protein
MYKLEHLNPQKAQGLPLYPVRLTPTGHTDYANAREWCQQRNLTVHIPRNSHHMYFNTEAEATLFILGYTGL